MIEIPKNDKEYFAHPFLSNSSIKLINRSIDHYLYEKKHPKTTDAMTFGSAFHCYILEPNEFDKRFVVNPFASKRGNQYKDFALAAQEQNRLIITQQQLTTLTEMKQTLIENPEAKYVLNMDDEGELLGDGAVEQAHLFYYKRQGCKCKIDYESKERNIIVDLKTTINCENMDTVNSKAIVPFQLFQQSAFYKLGYSLANESNDVPAFVFIFIEKDPPYGIQCVETDIEYERMGLKLIDRGIARWKYYWDNKDNDNEYWGYPAVRQVALMPPYLKNKYL